MCRKVSSEVLRVQETHVAGWAYMRLGQKVRSAKVCQSQAVRKPTGSRRLPLLYWLAVAAASCR